MFDISQTDGEPVPTLEVPELTGDQEQFDVFMEAIRKVSPVPIRVGDVPGEAKGYYDNANKEIVIREGMSQSQTMKTAAHELGHSLCHDRDFLKSVGEKKDRVTMELEAESIANCVCAWFGLDTGDYSYPYIAGWAADRDRNILRESMDLIRTASGEVIDGMMEVFKEHGLIKGQDLDHDQVNDFYEIYQIDPEGAAKDQMFLGWDYLERNGIPVRQEDYLKVYGGGLDPGMTFEDIYTKFNLDHPEDFKGHSLSVGDVVVLNRGGKQQTGFVDIVGFKDVPGFLSEKVLERTRGQAVGEKKYDPKKKYTQKSREEAVRL